MKNWHTIHILSRASVHILNSTAHDSGSNRLTMMLFISNLFKQCHLPCLHVHILAELTFLHTINPSHLTEDRNSPRKAIDYKQPNATEIQICTQHRTGMRALSWKTDTSTVRQMTYHRSYTKTWQRETEGRQTKGYNRETKQPWHLLEVKAISSFQMPTQMRYHWRAQAMDGHLTPLSQPPTHIS